MMYLLISWIVLSSPFSGVDAFQKNTSDKKVLLFLSHQCPCSHSHVQHLNELAKEYPETAFFGVIADRWEDSKARAMNEYFSGENFQFPVIDDPEQVLIKKYGALKTPHTTLIERRGDEEKVLYQGGVTSKRSYLDSSKKFLAENLQALAEGKSVKYTSGKSLGCYIRRL